MLRLASLVSLATLALGAATAAAQPEVHDHRTPPPQPHYRHRAGPRFMLPLRFDIGMIGGDTSNGFLPGVELRLGVHWASLSPRPTHFDVGVGVFGAALVGPETTNPMQTSSDVVYGGAYLEVGRTLSQGQNWRTWAAGRGEYLGSNAFGKDSTGFGVAGRLGAELYVSGVGIEPGGLFLGSYAIGVYAEAGARGLGNDVSPFQISGGLTFRTPLVFTP